MRNQGASNLIPLIRQKQAKHNFESFQLGWCGTHLTVRSGNTAVKGNEEPQHVMERRGFTCLIEDWASS